MSTEAKKPSVALIITRMIYGGAQENVLLISERLLKKGYRVVFMHGPGDANLLKQLPKHPDFEKVFIPEFRRRILPFQDILAFFRIYHYLKAHPVDIVHTHTSKAGILGRWAARWAGVPVILHSPRGSIYHSIYFSKIVQGFFAQLEKLTAAFTDKIVTVSESEKADYIRLRIASSEKFATIYSGIEVERYENVQRNVEAKKKELGISSGVPVIGYVARFTPEKDHPLCLNAFQKVLASFPKAELVLVGDGPNRNDVEEEIKKRGIEKNVHLLGTRSDIPQILAVLDCYVQTSVWEGLPRSMVEAMLAERCVVATRVGGIPEVILDGKTGFLVPESNPDAFAEKIIKVLNDKDLACEIGKSARKHMKEVFDVNRTSSQLADLYEGILKNRHPEAKPKDLDPSGLRPSG